MQIGFQASLRDAVRIGGIFPPVNWRAIVSGPAGTGRCWWSAAGAHPIRALCG